MDRFLIIILSDHHYWNFKYIVISFLMQIFTLFDLFFVFIQIKGFFKNNLITILITKISSKLELRMFFHTLVTDLLKVILAFQFIFSRTMMTEFIKCRCIDKTTQDLRLYRT